MYVQIEEEKTHTYKIKTMIAMDLLSDKMMKKWCIPQYQHYEKVMWRFYENTP